MKRTGLIVVADVMTPDPVCVHPETPIAQAMEMFDRHDFNALPVVNADRTLTGIVTKLDLLRVIRPDLAFHVPEPDAVAALPVRKIMRTSVVNVEAEDALTVAMELMVSTRLRSLPVIRRGGGAPQLIGIVTQGDVMRAFRTQLLGGVAPDQETPELLRQASTARV